MTKKEFYQEKLNNFLDNNDITTGNDLDGNIVTLAYSNELYDIVEKLNQSALLIKNKGLLNSEFMQFFEDVGELDYQENYIYCSCCGCYARHNYYGTNGQFYIDDSEVVCKNCMSSNDYIEYLINNKKSCNTMLDVSQVQACNYSILSDYQFNNDMYGGLQCNKVELEKLLDDNNIKFFYWLDNCHMFGTYYTIVVHDNNIDKVTSLLNQSKFIKFYKGY